MAIDYKSAGVDSRTTRLSIVKKHVKRLLTKGAGDLGPSAGLRIGRQAGRNVLVAGKTA